MKKHMPYLFILILWIFKCPSYEKMIKNVFDRKAVGGGNWLFICTVWHLIGHIKLTYITSYQNRKVNISLFDLHFLSFSKTRVLEKCFVQTNKQSVIASKVVTSEVLFHFYVVCVVTLYIFHWKFYILRLGYVQLDNSCVS